MARTADQIQRDIDRIRSIRTSGVRSNSVDGQATTFQSDEELVRVLNALETELAAARGECNMAKPRLSSFNLGGRT